MKDRPFPDKSITPTAQAIQIALGSAHAYYKKVLGLVSTYSQEWAFSKSSGWILKVYDRKKALFYLIPLNDGFKISLTIRENERHVFLLDEELGMLHDKISLSRKYPEGFSLRFDIAGKNEFQPVELFIKKLITIRA